MNKFIIFGLVFMAFGLYAVWIYIKDSRKSYQIVPGKIVDFKAHMGHKGTKGFTTIFEYYYQGVTYTAERNINGAKYSKNSDIVEGTPKIYYTKNRSIVPNSKYKIGDSIEVRVYESEPERAVINTKSDVFLPLIMGGVFILIGVLILTISYIV